MQRVSVIGNSGGGKSRLARHLARQESLPYFEVDAFLWQRGWKIAPAELYDREHARIIDNDYWVLDGIGSTPSIAPRLGRSTEIILIDLPLWVHFWLAADRQTAWAAGEIENPPAGMDERPPTEGLFKNIWDVDQFLMPMLRTLIDAEEVRGKHVTRITSLRQLNSFYGRDAG